MRRYCLLLVCCVLLTGCAPGAEPPEEQLKRTESITAKWNDVTFVLSLTETGCCFTFHTPKELVPLTLRYDGERMQASYDGMEMEIPVLFAEGIMPLYRGILAYRTARAEDAGKGIRRITLDGKEFLLYYDPVGGLITHLEVKGAESTLVYQVLARTEKE